ncbi:Putative arginine/ornithine antiporter [Candidatus Erwinia haradaeae]|uniref:Arginine/ornithine antiporter, partial n=1 Tax=Candidatus Erwinia haradaeae TaxID=1922217 RepID=A0A451CYZ4_9GAMM|nr:Putative arginine/ornithine antiporter [Candidatus Erwinia haradaeae]
MNKKLGLSALTALVLSSMLGAGIFNLPQNMAAVASPAALLIAWSITGGGIILLALTLIFLRKLTPNLDGGIFIYAQAGFGNLIGFCSAWGYWLSAIIANAAYLVIIFSSISIFSDSSDYIVFGNGNTYYSLLASSLLLWLIHALIVRGVKTAANVNLIATIGKLLPLGLFIVLASINFRYSCFQFDFIGQALEKPIWQQVKDAMLITLWVFIGIEGAVVMSERARNKNDISSATLLAVLAALAIYILVTLISLGVVSRKELAMMHNPSMAGLMHHLMGYGGTIIIVIGLILSVCGAYLSWTIMAAEVPLITVINKSFLMPSLSLRNVHGAPTISLYLTNALVQIGLILIYLTNCDYNVLLTIASEMILLPYLLVTMYLFKVALSLNKPAITITAIGASIYGIWLLYASGLTNFLLSLLLYLPGILVFYYNHWTKKEL